MEKNNPKKTLKEESEKNSRKLRDEVDMQILEWLFEDWNYLKDIGGQVINTRTTIHPNRLTVWLQKFPIEHILASLTRLKEKNYVSDFDYLEVHSEDEYDFQDRLSVDFQLNFEEKFWASDTIKTAKGKDEKSKIIARASVDLHVFFVDMESKKKVHSIFDKTTGEIRFDKTDTPPGELLSKIESTLTTKDGRRVQILFKFE